MKSFIVGLAVLFAAGIGYSQEVVKSSGNFGENITKKGAVSVKKIPAKMKDSGELEIKVKGKITEVCQAKGCWMTLDMGNDELIRVKFKDYGFFVPKDAAGKTAVIDGIAKKEIIGVGELKHLAEDAGKSQQEIDAITESKEELTFMAKGVIIQ